MTIIQFLLSLVRKFVDMPVEKYEEIKGKAMQWYSQRMNRFEIDSNKPLEFVKEEELTPTEKIEAKIVWFNEQWWFQLAMAIFFIRAQRWVAEYIADTHKIANGTMEEDYYEED